jgi:hypothetical protein
LALARDRRVNAIISAVSVRVKLGLDPEFFTNPVVRIRKGLNDLCLSVFEDGVGFRRLPGVRRRRDLKREYRGARKKEDSFHNEAPGLSIEYGEIAAGNRFET